MVKLKQESPTIVTRIEVEEAQQQEKKTNCPFQLIYNKVDRKPNYYLAKYR